MNGIEEDVMAPKRPQAAAEKRAEIVAAARRLFIDAGYDATPMSRLAKEAGVAPNTIYWYFPDKDEVLIAVLEAVMADVWPQYEEIASQPIAARLLWIVGKLTEMSRLVTTVHARVEHSAAVAEWHQNFHTITGSLLQFELQAAGVPAPDAEVMIGVFTVEGLLMHDHDEAQQRAIIDALASRWTTNLPRPSDLGR
ncbi:TetR/AcrR family transcriptional regulator [Mycolicibacterium smegmatis]|uniref:Transcriptional regulator n=3 Tax=Mycolicibacterium smegmatis TaxID=1772 RepID=A0R0N5_MYCS2|nr:putative transcriptional regulator [Mycolicibacterium smegmatis MC2 155]TBM40369.1 TetR/AcrR family transcriptional regulator [Mycolicibacterium smegmatis]TBH33115.1 TetR/AcrR family transcriptional regulator [Mycolicibacterium smegmatis MC2 155]TBM48453.1 TetR/AcrR family transcriptional regulator [Mycolicibacterium smegmatis]TBM58136.1 TetR/AcrR family transcriptional regulator [Mycolicibacterium smegmatis]